MQPTRFVAIALASLLTSAADAGDRTWSIQPVSVHASGSGDGDHITDIVLPQPVPLEDIGRFTLDAIKATLDGPGRLRVRVQLIVDGDVVAETSATMFHELNESVSFTTRGSRGVNATGTADRIRLRLEISNAEPDTQATVTGIRGGDLAMVIFVVGTIDDPPNHEVEFEPFGGFTIEDGGATPWETHDFPEPVPADGLRYAATSSFRFGFTGEVSGMVESQLVFDNGVHLALDNWASPPAGQPAPSSARWFATRGSLLLDVGDAESIAGANAIAWRRRGQAAGPGVFTVLGDGDPNVKMFFDPPADTDGDGLFDDWEVNGIPYIDSSGIERRLILDSDGDGVTDANPCHKDLFVEIDAMQGLSFPAAAAEQVIFAFETAPLSNPGNEGDGITLHLLHDDTDLTHVAEWLVTGCWPNDFYDYKAMRFGTANERIGGDRAAILAAKAKAFRYCIMADRSNPGYGGCGELEGNDFVVYRGAYADNEDIAATFMHELGHNIGLDHGGFDGVNGKPNYPSIMYYLFVGRQGWNRTFWRLDFLRNDDFVPFSEAKIDESRGIGIVNGFYADWRAPFGVWVNDENGDPVRTIKYARLNGTPTDFGDPEGTGYQDNETDGTVRQDLNYVADPPPGIRLPTEPSPDEYLRTQNDWEFILLRVLDQGGSPDGGPRFPDEPTLEALEWIDENFPDPPCLMDFNNNGEVDFSDLLELLNAWGNENDHAHDVAPEGGDGVIDFTDLLAVLAAWGSCE